MYPHHKYFCNITGQDNQLWSKKKVVLSLTLISGTFGLFGCEHDLELNFLQIRQRCNIFFTKLLTLNIQ